MTNRERTPSRKQGRNAKAEVPVLSETAEQRLMRAVRGLLDALDRCAGDPPDCPHCGEARAFANEVLTPTAVPESPKNEQERVQVSGRAGADPTFRTTAKGTEVGRFSLAVRNADDSTTWFPVVAFNRRAEQLKGAVTKGAALSVVGYLHTRETKARDGSPRTVKEIYAVTVTPLASRQRWGS